ncbi:NAD(P)H-dependent oxidoreductase [Enterococcus casseliflavus]|uniref:NAD(P)H-dependent oxidoreductase n=3 Tax=Enterococcus casseliflavus TaxID=37734 RepID=UPI001E4C8380|nr:NAD(P)H-dependent oxidoreductase [Enterococcus casseliflavus]MCD5161416.1 NAD(P)H-dependent oxidoreductase [Enterococcus casseliflavus]
MNVFIFYGNNNPRGSKTNEFIQSLIGQLNEMNTVNTIYYRDFNNTHLDFITSWIETINNNKEVIEMKKEMLDSQIIIFISPVFSHNISSQMKLFVEHLSSWIHTMPLVGKLGIPISISNNNGNDTVNNYLKKIMEYFGLSIIPAISIKAKNLTTVGIESFANYTIRQINRNLPKIIELITDNQELIFKSDKQVNSILEVNHPERIEFFDNDYSRASSLKEFLQNK